MTITAVPGAILRYEDAGQRGSVCNAAEKGAEARQMQTAPLDPGGEAVPVQSLQTGAVGDGGHDGLATQVEDRDQARVAEPTLEGQQGLLRVQETDLAALQRRPLRAVSCT